MRNKLTLIITITSLILGMLACQAKTQMATSANANSTNSTNVNSNTAEKPTSETTTASVSEPEPIVLEFYLLYLKGLVANKELSSETMKRYLTERMLKEIKETTDEDVVIKGSDYDETWAENVIIKGKEKLGDTKTVVTVELKGKEFSKILKVNVVAQDKTWKIDSVKDTKAVGSADDSAESSKVKTTTVKFEKGKTSAEFEGSIGNGETQVYLINVQKGQYLGAQTYSESEDDVAFMVRKKGGAELEVPKGSVKWGGDIPETGDYEIVISGIKKTTKYSITINAE